MRRIYKQVSRWINENRRILPGISIAFFLAALLIIKYGYQYHLAVQDEIEAKRELYAASAAMVPEENELEDILRAAESRVDVLEKGLLDAKRAPVGAAMLQRAVREMSIRRGITIKSEKALQAVEAGSYIKIPVEVQFAADMPQIKNLLYDVLSSPLIMGIKSIRIKTNSERKLELVLTIEGAIRKTDAKENL